jgi:hypothetical protein
MSYGLLICSMCQREVHQGKDRRWHHCEDKTPCAAVIYAEKESDIKGKWCGRDDFDKKFKGKCDEREEAKAILEPGD